MGYTAAYFAASHKLTNGCSQLSPDELREFLEYLNVENIHKFNVEKISWFVKGFLILLLYFSLFRWVKVVTHLCKRCSWPSKLTLSASLARRLFLSWYYETFF
jgi:hypothetical protein